MRRVLDAARRTGRSALPRLEADSGLRRTRLETLLKVLDVDGAVERVDGGWVATGRDWIYDAQRLRGDRGGAPTRAARDAALRARRVRASCGSCAPNSTTRSRPTAGGARCAPVGCQLAEPRRLTRSARRVQHLRSQTVVIEPRKMWPSGAPRRGRIAESARAEPGRALALAEDPAWLDAGQRGAARATSRCPTTCSTGWSRLLSQVGLARRPADLGHLGAVASPRRAARRPRRAAGRRSAAWQVATPLRRGRSGLATRRGDQRRLGAARADPALGRRRGAGRPGAAARRPDPQRVHAHRRGRAAARGRGRARCTRSSCTRPSEQAITLGRPGRGGPE